MDFSSTHELKLVSKFEINPITRKLIRAIYRFRISFPPPTMYENGHLIKIFKWLIFSKTWWILMGRKSRKVSIKQTHCYPGIFSKKKAGVDTLVPSNNPALFRFVAYKELQSHWTEQHKDQKITNSLSLSIYKPIYVPIILFKLLIPGFKRLFGHCQQRFKTTRDLLRS